ncbi:MAG: hypothetical protein IT308_08685 [Anaerolineaceae bacterium]|nr:hypothetical protein [Anaerolineaceae bacterium]
MYLETLVVVEVDFVVVSIIAGQFAIIKKISWVGAEEILLMKCDSQGKVDVYALCSMLPGV